MNGLRKVLKKIDLPGIPKQFHIIKNYKDAYENAEIVMKILDIFNIYYTVDYIDNYSTGCDGVDYGEEEHIFAYFEIEDGKVKFSLKNDRASRYRTDLNMVIGIDTDEILNYGGDDIINDPYDLIDYLIELGLISTNNWMKKINGISENNSIHENKFVKTFEQYNRIDEGMEEKRFHTTKIVKRMNEELSEENISKNPNTSYEEKEKLRIKLRIDHINKFKSKRGMFDSMFANLSKEIDVTTLNKLVGDNQFMKQYTELLYKKRDLGVVKLSINRKKEEISEIKRGIIDSKNEDEIDEMRKKINQVKSDLTDLNRKLSDYKDIEQIIKKWDKQLYRSMSDLKQGQSYLTSTIDDIRN